jgi:hypothetical protein
VARFREADGERKADVAQADDANGRLPRSQAAQERRGEVWACG